MAPGPFAPVPVSVPAAQLVVARPEPAPAGASVAAREARRQLEERGLGEGEVVYGMPPDAILSVASAWEADLIVMGTHGRKGIDDLLFGSVAEQVVRSSPVPVLTVRAE